MKHFLIVLLVLGVGFRVSAGSNVAAVAYNQSIMLEQDKVGYRLANFMQQVTGKNLILLQMQILNSIETLNATQPYENDSTFLIAARELFNCYKEVSKYQYPKILQLVENPDVADEQFNQQLDAIRKEITDIEAPFDKKFSEEQEKFAQKYGFQFKQ